MCGEGVHKDYFCCSASFFFLSCSVLKQLCAYYLLLVIGRLSLKFYSVSYLSTCTFRVNHATASVYH